MKPHPAEMKLMALRQHDAIEAEAGADGSGFKMLAVFLGREAHGKTKLLQYFAPHHGASGLRAEMFSTPANSANLAWLMISEAA
jgi:hypothetical protein